LYVYINVKDVPDLYVQHVAKIDSLLLQNKVMSQKECIEYVYYVNKIYNKWKVQFIKY
jgi:hypothetical protein